MGWHLIDRYLEHKHPNKSLAEIAASIDEEDKAEGRNIARRYTRGNVSIQFDDFNTSEDRGAPGALRSPAR